MHESGRGEGCPGFVGLGLAVQELAADALGLLAQKAWAPPSGRARARALGALSTLHDPGAARCPTCRPRWTVLCPASLMCGRSARLICTLKGRLGPLAATDCDKTPTLVWFQSSCPGLGLTRFDGHPSSGVRPRKDVRSWRAWGKSPGAVVPLLRSSRPRSLSCASAGTVRWARSPGTLT